MLTDRQTNGPTDQQTDGPTDKASYRVACPQIKKMQNTSARETLTREGNEGDGQNKGSFFKHGSRKSFQRCLTHGAFFFLLLPK